MKKPYSANSIIFALCILSLSVSLPALAQDAEPNSATDYAGLIINELLPNPAGTDSGNEFIELYNKSTNTIDLSGLSIRDNAGRSTYTFAQGEILAANNYRVLYNSTDFTFALNNTFDEVTLFTSTGTIISSLSYESVSENMSWNAADTTYEQTPTPNAPNTPLLSEEGAQPEDEQENEPEEGSENTPDSTDQPGENESDEDTTQQEPSETQTDDETNSDQESPSENDDQTSTDEDTQESFPPIILNEIYANPYGSDNTGEFIELFNPTSADTILKDWQLKDASSSNGYTFGESVVIPSENFLTIFRSTSGIALNNSGDETVSLIAPSGSISSSMTYSGAQEGTSYAWENDVWTQTVTPTPNSTNSISQILQCTVPQEPTESENPQQSEENPSSDDGEAVPPTQDEQRDDASLPEIALSELFPNPSGSDTENEFIELYNPSDQSISLEGWALADASAGGRYTFLSDAIIEAQSYLVVKRSTFGFALNNTGIESVTLTKPGGTISSTVSYSGVPESSSYNFFGGSWETSNTVTPGQSNIRTQEAEVPSGNSAPEDEKEEVTPTPTGPFLKLELSEVYPNPATVSTDEFIEIYNPHDQEVSLFGYTLSDASISGSFTFGTEDSIPPRSYKTFDRNQTKIALNNTGTEIVTLTNPEGSIDATVTFVSITKGLSFALIDGVWKATSSVTPNAQNRFVITSSTTQSPTDSQDSSTEQAGDALPPIPTGPFLQIELSEVLPNPATGTNDEFIELYNPHDTEVNLFGYTLSDASKSGSFTFGPEDTIAPKSYLAIGRDTTKIALNNSGTEVVTLTNPEGALDATVTFISIAKGKSFALINGIWRATSTVTPDQANIFSDEQSTTSTESTTSTKISESDVAIPEGPFLTLNLNEILPNPAGSDTQAEYIEIYNPNDQSVDLQGWILRDGSVNGKYVIKDLTIESNGYGVIYRTDSGIALNNTGEESVTLLSPDEKVVSTFTYTGSDESISYNFDGVTWLTSTEQTPGTPNIFFDPNDSEEVENLAQSEIVDLIILDSYPQIFISEILPNPVDDESTNEFIELYNPTIKDITLRGWTLKDASKNGSFVFTDHVIRAGNYLSVFRDEFGFALNNTGTETLTLIAPNQIISDTLTYEKTTEGVSLGRQTFSKDQPFLPTKEPTPNQINSFTLASTTSDQAGTSTQYPTIFLSELFPSPQVGQQEFIEIYNPQNFSVNLSGWELRDGSKNGSYTFDDTWIIDPGEYLFIEREIYKFALNNSGGETVTLFDPSGTTSSTIRYDKVAKDISYGWTGDPTNSNWRFSPNKTPGSKNIFPEELFITDIDIDSPYKDTKTEFDVDYTGATDVKFRWDFGNGKKSTKENPTHTYDNSGTYSASVEIISDIESKIQNFEVEIEKYPKRKIRITKILPNPEGKDTGKETGNEYIVITNQDKKTVSLKGWSIATGKDEDSLSNHPLKKTIKLKAGESKQITKNHSAISLNNKGGTIELRSPDGKAVDTISYDYPQASSIPENLGYTKIEGVWSWDTPVGKQKALIDGLEQLEGLTLQEQEEIIAIALQNMQQNNQKDAEQNNQNWTQTTPTLDGSTSPATPQKSQTLWEIFKAKVRQIFRLDHKDHFSEKKSFTGPKYDISKTYTNQICQAKPPYERSVFFKTHCNSQ